MTERKRIETQLRAQAASLQEQASLLDVAHDAIILRELDGKILLWNHGAELAYGWNKSEAVGQRSHTLFQTQFPIPLAEIDAVLLREGSWEGELVHTSVMAQS